MSPLKFIDIAPGLSILPTHAAAVKDAGDGRAVIFLKGTGALDGFVVERDWTDVVDELNEALERQAGARDDEDEEDDAEEGKEGNQGNAKHAPSRYTHTAVNAHGHRIGTPNHGKTWHDVITGEQIA